MKRSRKKIETVRIGNFAERPNNNKYSYTGKSSKLNRRAAKELVSFFLSVVFMSFLLIFGVISIVDSDKSVSELENRKLEQKPTLSISSISDGSFMSSFEKYYSDQFPLRNGFLSVGNKLKNFFTQFSSDSDGDVIVKYKKNEDDFGGEGIDLGLDSSTKKSDETKTESTNVTEKPTQKNHENDASSESQTGSIIINDTRAMEIFSYNKNKVNEKYISLLNRISSSLPGSVKMYSMLCPTSIEFYGSENYTTGSNSQWDAINDVYSKLDKSITTVDAYSKIAAHTDEYIYFRTDHHWTARGAYYGYTAFCDAAGLTAPALVDFSSHTLDGFLGSLYKLTQSDKLKNHPDEVECFDINVEATNMVYSSAEMTDGIKSYVVAGRVNDDNKYLAFISGDQPLSVITTNVGSGKKIMVIKESYGNALVPFLCNNYDEIYVVDPRKVEFNLSSFITEHEIDELLVINYSFCMTNDTFCDDLNKMV